MSQEAIIAADFQQRETPGRTGTASLATTPLQLYYHALYEKLGPQSWWPAKTPFEVIVGAILTQNTNWTNVERAIANLRREHLLSP
ncbi:MAG: hypothetical protein ACRD4H_11885, partial [Candidatus Acidiferrales bacterium]